MNRIIAGIVLIALFPMVAYTQSNRNISGKVIDETGKGLPGCHVHYQELCLITGFNGEFVLEIPDKVENYHLTISFIGYVPLDTLCSRNNTSPVFQLKPENIALSEVSVTGFHHASSGTLKREGIRAEFLEQNHMGTFVKSIERLPGINSMDIGANASKPIIRGLGFNRVVVSENGIKQEGQQWGADHGLEIDPFAIESAIVSKGATSVEYGSGAMGGNIAINNHQVPPEHTAKGNITLVGRTVNQSLAASAHYALRAHSFFMKVRGSYSQSGDYSVPTDTIIYLTRAIPVVNRQLKNSAGTESDGHVQLGWVFPKFRNTLSVSNVNQKAGFFPGAHGVPDISRVQDDGNRFNMEYPYQQVNHLKAINNVTLIGHKHTLNADLAYQNNQRQERSRFHTHYPGQTPPVVNPDLELEFRLQTYTANFKLERNLYGHHLDIGWQNQYQHNKVGGYNFLLPEYNYMNNGIYINDTWEITHNMEVSAGLRFDYSKIRIMGFYDTILYNYLINMQYAEEYAWRTRQLQRTFYDFSGLVGWKYQINDAVVARMNAGKSFRNPTPIELGSNGIHHGSFRHEKGDPKLDSEKAYYLDQGIDFTTGKHHLSVSGYQFWFTNFIFLNPTGQWSVLPHAGQIYQYMQSPAFITGIEVTYKQQFSRRIHSELQFESIYNKQLNSNSKLRYPLPFTPPTNLFAEVEYKPKRIREKIQNRRFFANARVALPKNRIARNEVTTKGYAIFGAGLSCSVLVQGFKLDINVQVSNLLNTFSLNHVSFYRKLELPEPGRDVRILVKIPLNKNS